MHHITYTRRQVVKMMAGLGLTGIVSPFIAAFADDNTVLNLPDFSPDAPLEATVELFEAFSTLVTLQADLNNETVNKMYEVIADEPWGKEHLVDAYRAIRIALDAEGSKPDVYPNNQPNITLTDGERWFIDHILTTWYLGIYYHQERPTQRIAYENALMFTTIRDLVPIPYIDAVGFGGWTDKPVTAA